MRTHEQNSQEEIIGLKRKLQSIIQNRQTENGQYHEIITPKYQLALEYHKHTLYLSLNMEEKTFRQIVCNEGSYKSKNGLLAKEIFQAFMLNPEFCQIDPQKGVLIIRNKREIELQEIQLNQTMKQKIEFGRTARECLKYIRGEKDVVKKQQQREIKQVKHIQQQQKIHLEKQLKIQQEQDQCTHPLQQGKIHRESLLVLAPHPDKFLIQDNNITLQKGGDYKKMLLRGVIERSQPFAFHVQVINTKSGRIHVGVLDRRTEQSEKPSSLGNKVLYVGGGAGYIYYPNKGKENRKQTGVMLKEGTELRMKLELEKGIATFIAAGQQFSVHSDILSQPQRQFAAYFEMCEKGDSIKWRVE